MVVLIVAALVCCAFLAYRAWRLEERVADLEEWAGADAHDFITFTPEDDDDE